jgi:hypothetical protein
MTRLGAIALLAVLAPWASAQAASWHHLQIAGVTTVVCSVEMIVGSEIYTIDDIPVQTTAADLAESLEREINSARHGHLLFATRNGLDGSIVSLVADGSPTPSTTPWLGRLIPRPRITILPNDSGITIDRTDIDNTLAAVRIEGQVAPPRQAELTTRINGKVLTLTIAGTASEEAMSVANRLSDLINTDPGFRSSALEDDTGQLMIFVTGENLGGGLRIDSAPSGIDGLNFSNSSTLFASETPQGVVVAHH